MPRQYTPPVDCTCQGCGTVFAVLPNRIRRGGGKYCTRRCAAITREREKLAAQPIADLFWSKVDKSGDCWLWTAATFPDGYGVFGNRRHFGTQRANRIAYILTHGPIDDALSVCHHCDNPLCVRPDHLFLGTAADNQADKVRKGRQARGDGQGLRKHPGTAARGEWQHLAVLTAEQVREIRRQHAEGIPQSHIAARFGLGTSTVCSVVHRRTWRHVE